MPGKVEALAADRKGAQEKATARLQEAQSRLVEAQTKVADSVTTLPTDLKILQEKAQSFALQQVGRAVELAVKAKEAYDELAERGKGVVDRGRPAESTPVAAEPASAKPVEAEPEAVDAELVEDDEPGAEAATEPAAERAVKKSPGPARAPSSPPAGRRNAGSHHGPVESGPPGAHLVTSGR